MPITAGVEASRGATGPRNLVELLEAQVARQGARTAALSKRGGRWVETSWHELARRMRDIADGLAAVGVRPGDRVGLLADTSTEAAVADAGIAAAAAVVVPIYPSSTPRECEYALDHAGCRWVVCDREEQVEKIRAVRERLPALEGVVRVEGEPRGAFEHTVADLERVGQSWGRQNPGAHAARVAALGPDDPACIIYTSGTTGRPKGAVLTHGNWLYQARAVAATGLVRPDDLSLFFLPIAHGMGRLCASLWIEVGCTAAFAESFQKVGENAAEVRPTIIPAPPRLYEKVFAGVVSRGASAPGAKGVLFRAAMDAFDRWVTAKQQGRDGRSLGLLLARRVVFPRVAEEVSQRLGGRIRVLVSGSAPLSPKIGWFFEALGIPLLEGYGMTECGAAATLNAPGAHRIGSVGRPLAGTEVRIADDGEIFLRNPSVMQGYWRDPAATAETIGDGWLHTGDVGVLDDDGYLHVTDRKKDIIATAGGKKVAPQHLESALKADPLISQVMVHGDRRPYLTALLTLDQDAVRRWAEAGGIALSEPPEADPQLRARLQRSLDALNAELPSYSTIKAFDVVPGDFAPETGELTPTLKLRRRACAEKYAAVLDRLYGADAAARIW